MGIEDSKIDKSQIGSLAKRVISSGRFGRFSQEFSKDLENSNLPKLKDDIKNYIATKPEQQNNIEK